MSVARGSFEALCHEGAIKPLDYENPAWLGERWHIEQIHPSYVSSIFNVLVNAQSMLVTGHISPFLLAQFPVIPPISVVRITARMMREDQIYHQAWRNLEVVQLCFDNDASNGPLAPQSMDVVYGFGLSMPTNAPVLLKAGGVMLQSEYGQYHLQELRRQPDPRFYEAIQPLVRSTPPMTNDLRKLKPLERIEEYTRLTFHDIGALMYYLRLINYPVWRTGPFTPADWLFDLHRIIESQVQPFVLHNHLIVNMYMKQ